MKSANRFATKGNSVHHLVLLPDATSKALTVGANNRTRQTLVENRHRPRASNDK